jgi:hypothetical protein
MEFINKQMRCIFSLVMLLTMLGFSQSAFAVKQCVKYDTVRGISVAWYNLAGEKQNASPNTNPALRFTSCIESKESGLSYAVVNCNGCIFDKRFKQAGVAIAGGVFLGICKEATAGACLKAAPEVAEEVVLAVQKIPNSDWKKRVVVPQNGQTIVFSNLPFGIVVN